ncbi:MAG: HAD family hydrolase [Clostridia bacterium]|nr:HAD family hydrolase [Clostridia bacterium]
MNTRISRILFDYDGTLIIHDKENEGRQVSKLLGFDEWQTLEFEKRLKDYLENHFVLHNVKITRRAHYENLQNVFRPEEIGSTVKAIDDAITENSIVSTKLADNAKETLEYLASRGYELCVFTNGFYAGQVANMKHKGIFEYFEKVYAWDNFYAKPDERAYFRALAKTDPKTNIMIGDTIATDIVPAQKLGLYTVGINLEGRDMTQGRPDVIISDLSELREIL